MAAAGLIKAIIIARAKQEPNILKRKEFKRWNVDLPPKNHSCVYLLQSVKRLRYRLERKYFDEQDSIQASSVSAGWDCLLEQVASFIQGDLDEAIRTASRGKKVPWKMLADWNALDALRDALDLLPKSITDDRKVEQHDQGRPPTHSADFRSVNWFGAEYSFTANQAACVKFLWSEWRKGTPEVSTKVVIDQADISSSRLSMVFRGNPAWGTMIVKGATRGTVRLSSSDQTSEIE